jgi:3-methyladenine DNA glycosylase AlkD
MTLKEVKNMNLIKDLWTKEDINDFLEYLQTFANPAKEVWGRKILNTKQDLLCLKTKDLDLIVEQIYKGNFLSYLDLRIFGYYETVAIYGKLITKIIDFQTLEHYLNIYLPVMENWAHCDLLNFEITSSNKEQFLRLSEAYVSSDLPFVRRLSLFIMLLIVRAEKNLAQIINRILQLNDEQDYYVIMMGGWLLSECIIRYEKATLEYLKKNAINPKIINKAIQKCRESRRLDQTKKDELLIFKKPNK